MNEFVHRSPTTDAYWRSVILFGQNQASYKFALGRALLGLADEGKTFVSLEELAEPYALSIVEHIGRADRQGTSPSSTFLEACRGYVRGEINKDELLARTVRYGFSAVLDAFHTVNHEEIPVRFFTDERKSSKGVNLTDELLAFEGTLQHGNLDREVEGRWRLVETAWSLGVSPSLLVARYDPLLGEIYVESAAARRVDVTSCRDALNGYQKGKCFYCSSEIGVEPGREGLCDVDHFFPHALVRVLPEGSANLNGVWNLVLSCRACNRGGEGKAARIPVGRYRERLYRRNEYLIGSHHPLRETLMAQTGPTPRARRRFLQGMYDFALGHLVWRWEPPQELEPVI